MKILHVITSLAIGGAQRLLSDILPLMAKTDKVSLLVYEQIENDFYGHIMSAGINVVSLDAHNYHNPIVVFRMRKIFKEYDVVHAHLFPTVYWASLACRGLKTKLVYTEHSTSNSRRGKWYFRPIEQFMYDRYDKVISISAETQESLMSWLESGKGDSRFVCINNGIDISRFALSNSAHKINAEKVKLMMVSRFAPAKDQKTIIRALTHLDARFQLELVGDGDTMENVRQYALEQGVSERVNFLGIRQNIPELIASCDIGIQSSLWEGFGLTAVEFMAAGKPIVASRVPGLEQVVEGAGLLFEKGNDIELATIINRLSTNEDEYNRVVEHCKIRAQEYDINNMVKAYMDVYQSLIGGGKYRRVIWTVYNPYSREQAA